MAKKKRRRTKAPLSVEATIHEEETRLNIPTAEYEAILPDDHRAPRQLRYPRNADLDPQLVWRGKDEQDWSDLVVPAPPLFIQEKVQPKALVDDLQRETEARRQEADPAPQPVALFGDFNGLPEGAEKTDFYRHRGNWSNRMILGDSLRVMASLAEREGQRGKVQCIYLDPPYGIQFNSNFQWSTADTDVKDGRPQHISREPEQVKAFRDIWTDKIHSYLTYLRDRLTVARDLLTESGSIFVQIGDENVHRVRALMDEVFGVSNYRSTIYFQTTGGLATSGLTRIGDYVLWYSKNREIAKHRSLFTRKAGADEDRSAYKSIETPTGERRRLTADEIRLSRLGSPPEGRVFRISDICGKGSPTAPTPFSWEGTEYHPPRNNHWKPNYPNGLRRVARADRVHCTPRTLSYVRFLNDHDMSPLTDVWQDTGHSGYAYDKIYVVQTAVAVIQRCVLMTTDPGDLVLDPTCGSGTTAYVAEQWGRRWITIDTSRVALALARARIMGARFPYYTLADSPEGQREEARPAGEERGPVETHGDIRQGFVYPRVQHIKLREIANNAEIDTIWEQRQPAVEEALAALNGSLAGHSTPFEVTGGGRKGQKIDFLGPANAMVELPNRDFVPAHGLMEWEVPRELPNDWPAAAGAALRAFWAARLARQKTIDQSIQQKAESHPIYDRPVEDDRTVRVAGPFTVESLAPHRTLAVDEEDRFLLRAAEPRAPYGAGESGDFATMILEQLRVAGVQQTHREDRIEFSSLVPWEGRFVAAEGRYRPGESGRERRAGVLIGPEFGTVSRQDLVDAAREAADAGFHALVSCAFAYDPHAAEVSKLGKVPILKARMNADLHLADDLKTTGKGNLFVVFGEPDIEIEKADKSLDGGGGGGYLRVRLRGVDVFHPQTGEIRSDEPDAIACWFLDTDYDGESFFVRHAYFPGAVNDPYKALKTTLKAEIDREAWDSLRREVSRPFPKPATGRIAVKVINHLGDEVLKVFRVP